LREAIRRLTRGGQSSAISGATQHAGMRFAATASSGSPGTHAVITSTVSFRCRLARQLPSTAVLPPTGCGSQVGRTTGTS